MLILSIVALFAGPLMYLWLRRGGRLARAVETTIVVVLVLLVGLLLVPETLETIGWPALALIAVGYLVPGLLEHALRGSARTLHSLSLALALLGLVLHALLDAAGLAGAGQQASATLALAIVLHRFGEGLVIWLIVQPGYGTRMAVGVLVLMSAATVLGYFLSEHFLALQGRQAVLVVQALVIGTILHSLVHRGHAGRHATVN